MKTSVKKVKMYNSTILEFGYSIIAELNRIETTIIFPKFGSNHFQLNLEVMNELTNLFSWFMFSRQRSNLRNNLFVILMFVKLHQNL